MREYWLVDPMRRQAEFYVRGGDGVFRGVPLAQERVYRSSVLPGFWLDVTWLWQRPSLLDVLAAWGMVPQQA